MAVLSLTDVDRGIILITAFSGLLFSLTVFITRHRLTSLAKGIRLFFNGYARLSKQLDEQRQRFEKCAKDINASLDNVNNSVRQSNAILLYTARHQLGSRLFYFDRATKPVLLVHSHRPEEKLHITDVKSDSYTVPAIPADEAPFVSIMWHLAMSSMAPAFVSQSHPPVSVACSCMFKELGYANNFILVGSTIL